MNKEYDAIFVHGQGYSNRTGRDSVASVRGRLQASAIRKMLSEGYRFDKFLFSGITFKNQKIPLADINANVVQRRAGVTESQMIIDQSARTSSMEVSFAKNKAEENRWKRVLHLTYGEVHQDQIKQHADRHYGRGVEVDVFRADEVLLDSTDVVTVQAKRNLVRYQTFLGGYNASDTEQGLLSYEKGWKARAMKVPFDLGSKFLNFFSKYYRPDPSN